MPAVEPDHTGSKQGVAAMGIYDQRVFLIIRDLDRDPASLFTAPVEFRAVLIRIGVHIGDHKAAQR